MWRTGKRGAWRRSLVITDVIDYLWGKFPIKPKGKFPSTEETAGEPKIKERGEKSAGRFYPPTVIAQD
jgi:hypothetical protein